MLKGIAALDEYLNTWLYEHDFDAVVELDTDFSVDLNSNTIYYALVVPQALDEDFIKVCRRLHNNLLNADTFLLSFFHELGHIETEDEWTEADWDAYNKFTATVDTNDAMTYFTHPIELAATKWGCDYIMSHIDEIKEFVNGYAPLITNIYQLNNVTAD